MKLILTSIALLLLSFGAAANVEFIMPYNMTSSTAIYYGDTTTLIKDATDVNYIAPDASGGGNGTSLFTQANYSIFTFNLDDAYDISETYLWDYYQHTPTQWLMNFYDQSDATGNELGTYSFNIDTASTPNSGFHLIQFSPFSEVRSITLSNVNLSSYTGVGLSELHLGGNLTSTNIQASTASNVSAPLMAFGGLMMLGAFFVKRK